MLGSREAHAEVCRGKEKEEIKGSGYGDPAREKWLDAALVAKCVRLAPLKLNKAALGKSLLVQAMGPGLGGEEVAESGRRAERSC